MPRDDANEGGTPVRGGAPESTPDPRDPSGGDSPLDPERMTEIEDYDPSWQFGGGQEWNVSLDTGGGAFRPANVHDEPDSLLSEAEDVPEGRPPAPHGPVDSGASDAVGADGPNPRTRELPQRRTLLRFGDQSGQSPSNGASGPRTAVASASPEAPVDPNGNTLILDARDFAGVLDPSGAQPAVDPDGSTLVLSSGDFGAAPEIDADELIGPNDATLTMSASDLGIPLPPPGAVRASFEYAPEDRDDTEALDMSQGRGATSAEHELSYDASDAKLKGFSEFEFGDTLSLDAESLARAAQESAERHAAVTSVRGADGDDFGDPFVGDTLPPPGAWSDDATPVPFDDEGEGIEATTMLESQDAFASLGLSDGESYDATALLDTSDGLPEGDEGYDATAILDTGAGDEDPGSTRILDLDETPGGATVLLQPEPGVELFDGERKVSRSVLPGVGELVIGRYEVKRIIGEGGFATVYEAIDGNVGGRVALKVMHAEKSYDQELAERFRQEVTLVRQLRHPNTIKITDAGTTEKGCLFMVAEFLPLETLEDFIEREGAVEPARAVHIVKQVLSSLAEAHEMGIVHRDLKPANVMIGIIAGEDDSVKVLDFGIAKALGDDMGSVHTKTGFVFCTPKYAPQEILLSQGVTPAADVYSLGLMFYELLTGHFPVRAQSDAEYIAHQLSPMPNPIPGVLAGTPLGVVLSRAMAKKAEDRYPSAREMLADVRALEDTTLPLGPIQLSDEETRMVETVFDSSNTTAHLPGPGGAVTAQMGADGRPAPGVQGGMTVMYQPDRGRNTRMVFLLLLSIFVVMIALWWVLSQRTPPEQPVARPEPPRELVVTPPVTERDMGPDTGAAPAPERLSARELLERNLALTSRQAGSWLEEEYGIAPGTAEGTGAIALARANLDAAAADRMSRLFEAADLNADVIYLIEDALREGDLDEAEASEAIGELIARTADIVGVMVEAGQCGAAEQRLEESLASLGTVPSQHAGRVSALRADIETCRALRETPDWDPSSYLALVREADQLERDAAREDDDDARRAMFFRSVYARQQAIDMLEAALAGDSLNDAQRENARADLTDLNQRVLATMLDLDLGVAANAQLAETLNESDSLRDEDAANLTALRQAMASEDEEEQARMAMAMNAEDTTPTEVPAEGSGGEAVASTQRPRGQFPAARPGAEDGSGAAVVTSGRGAFGGRGYRRLATQADALRDQADAITTVTSVVTPTPVETVEPVEGTPTETVGETTEPGRERVAAQQAPAAPRYRVRLRVRTNPSGVRVYINDEYVGRTPLDRVIEREEESVTMRLEKTDFREERITVSTLDPLFDREFELDPENPFGRTSILGGRGLRGESSEGGGLRNRLGGGSE